MTIIITSCSVIYITHEFRQHHNECMKIGYLAVMLNSLKNSKKKRKDNTWGFWQQFYNKILDSLVELMLAAWAHGYQYEGYGPYLLKCLQQQARNLTCYARLDQGGW